MWINRKRLEEIEKEKLRMKKDLKQSLNDNQKLIQDKLGYIEIIKSYEQILGHIAKDFNINGIDLPLHAMTNPLPVKVTETYNEHTRTVQIKWEVLNEEGKSNIK